MPRDGLSDPEEAIDVWPRGGCWLEDEACQFKGLERFGGFKGWQTAGLDAHKKPWMCGLEVPVGCRRRMKHAESALEGFPKALGEGCQVSSVLKGFMPMCGLGVPVGCRMKHANLRVRVWSVWKFFGLANGRLGRLEEAMGISQSIGEGLPSQQRFKGFKLFRGLEGLEGLERLERLEGLRAGKRQAWTPIRSHGCVALGCLLAAG